MYDILDDSPEAQRWRETQEQNFQQATLDYHALVNRVFSTEDGERLLTQWMKEQITRPIVISGQPLESHGIREGRASFVRDILQILELIKTNYGESPDD
jgi:hypothetical protein